MDRCGEAILASSEQLMRRLQVVVVGASAWHGQRACQVGGNSKRPTRPCEELELAGRWDWLGGGTVWEVALAGRWDWLAGGTGWEGGNGRWHWLGGGNVRWHWLGGGTGWEIPVTDGR
eukprot:365080-Chlamydomonas_euryale.AAC.10